MPQSKLLLTVLVMTIFLHASGQSTDTLFLAKAREKCVRSYEQATVVQSGLFNGSQYVEPKGTQDEHPFFISEEWQQGDVEYKEQTYTKLPLLYDISTDRLVSELFNGQAFVLVGEHLDRFTLGTRNFIKIQPEAIAANGLPAAGFYEEIYGGKTRALARHVKIREERIESTTLQIYFTPKSRYYLLVGNKYVRITNKASVLKALNDRKSELRQFINKNQLKFKGIALARSVASIASHYDTIKSAVD